MEIQIRVYRNAECLSKNEPCVRETVEVDDMFNFHGLVVALKTIWPDSMVMFNILAVFNCVWYAVTFM